MSSRTGIGNTVLGPGQWAAWVSEHGAHLLDYAGYHLGADRAPGAVAAAVAACAARTVPEGISARAWLLAVLRRDCSTAPGHREGYVPGTGPGMPDALLIERAWRLVEPLGAEILRLMFRHGLTPDDLVHVLALPAEEIDGLATRTQDVIETLVSALDALAHGRGPCPDLPPLVEAAFPGEQRRQTPAERACARTNLLSHMARCPTCTRPINIRYTVPQMSAHPPIPLLTAEARQRLLDTLPPAASPSTASDLPVPGALPPEAGRTGPVPRRGTAPYAMTDSGPVKTSRPQTSRPQTPHPQTSHPQTPHAQTSHAQTSRPQISRAPASRPQPPPLPDALLSPRWARAGETSPAERANLDIPPTIPDSTVRFPGGSGTRAHDPERPRGESRLGKALVSAGERARATTVKIVIIAVAGTAGTLTGMNLLGPALGNEPGPSALPSSLPRAATAGEPSASLNASAPGGAGDRLAALLRVPAEVTLDEYGRGSVTLTATSEAELREPREPSEPRELRWRVSAPGLDVTPSTGVLNPGETTVLALRALRVRHWCGAPAPMTVPLTVHGPGNDSISTTVRWRTC
ncbi:hypothetical protein [Planobispora rosea]|uniref:hypothetical protein n=1 Tax=Planobispora rosea TaxID=35762 RepID=UPI00083AED96|nr:hypothetical protein [Planobispora rosea]